MAGIAPHVLTFANEKGGTGKSTTAVHVAVALAAQGRSVAALDLDSRQRTLGRYLDNRLATVRRLGLELPMPAHDTFDPAKGESLDDAMKRVGAGSDFLIVDTPGRDDPYARQAIVQAQCSAKVREMVKDDPLVVEAFVMNDRGTLVCSTIETSDYWQGDEAKWQRTFVDGKDPFVEEPAFDASSGRYAIQVSVPIAEAGKRTGAVTLTLKLTRQDAIASTR